MTTPACTHDNYITCCSVGSFKSFTTEIFCVLCGRDGLTLSRHWINELIGQVRLFQQDRDTFNDTEGNCRVENNGLCQMDLLIFRILK